MEAWAKAAFAASSCETPSNASASPAKRSADQEEITTRNLDSWPLASSTTSEGKPIALRPEGSPSKNRNTLRHSREKTGHCLGEVLDKNINPPSSGSIADSGRDAFAAKFAGVHSEKSIGDAIQPEHTEDDCTDTILRKSPFLSDDINTENAETSTWLESTLHQRRRELKSKLSKSWANRGPEILWHKVLHPGKDQSMWWERVASLRSFRLQVVVLQMSIRRTILTSRQDKRHILKLLPQGHERRKIIEILSGNGLRRNEISAMVHIIQGRTDYESCKRFLKYTGHKPIFLLRYLLRPNADLSNVFVLHKLIQYVSDTYHGRRDWQRGEELSGLRERGPLRSKNPMLNMDPTLFSSTLAMLIQRCLEVESRLCLQVADVAIQYILNLRSWDQHPEKTFSDQCVVFNKTLAALSPRKTIHQTKAYRSFPHIWEAQRKLLTMSATLERPLLLNRRSFFAVQTVLAGQQKNQVESHSSSLHAQSWPPYLTPSDGMDETTEPELNWSRSVQANALAQEAGFDSVELEESLNILQGRAADGTPTIQQRLSRFPDDVTPWVASIRATRDAQEAWGRFLNPPQRWQRPGLKEYAAMFAKLLQPDVRPGTNLYPGDKALNFPVKQLNLSEFGRARLKPPTVSVLYERMLRGGIRPRKGCLNVLVWHAEDLETAHSYLRDSEIDYSILADTSIGDDLDPIKLRKIHMPLFSAYINVLCREHQNKNSLERAIFLSMKRFEADHANRWWAPRVWGMIMKAITEPYQRKKRPLHEQLNLHNQILGFVEARTFLPLSSYLQFCKSLRKMVAGELGRIMSDLEAGRQSVLATLYDSQTHHYGSSPSQDFEEVRRDRRAREQRDLHAINVSVKRMKQHFNYLVHREDEGREILRIHRIDPLDQILARRDPVRAEDAHEHLRTLAFVGEFDEMVNVLTRLAREWSDPDLCKALDECEKIPPMADFTQALCVFRLLAEPMLETRRVDRLRQTIEEAHAGWVWPDDEAVRWYRDMQDGQGTKELAHVLEWVRYRQRHPGLEAEFDMQLQPPGTLVEPKKETPSQTQASPGLEPRPVNRYAF
ncbi:unnamed protein product [Clonostachys rosea f. rosea IK726]|uniref:Uncharacterized protein n=1 Tax=Clonostachys rosea f. rosea IK726 TaxID=1349383 RepID=A0ACA9TK60_BIOOC|nr:unnamed protein product [Clonostachys rosea f. rosea IK726]